MLIATAQESVKKLCASSRRARKPLRRGIGEQPEQDAQHRDLAFDAHGDSPALALAGAPFFVLIFDVDLLQARPFLWIFRSGSPRTPSIDCVDQHSLVSG